MSSRKDGEEGPPLSSMQWDVGLHERVSQLSFSPEGQDTQMSVGVMWAKILSQISWLPPGRGTARQAQEREKVSTATGRISQGSWGGRVGLVARGASTGRAAGQGAGCWRGEVGSPGRESGAIKESSGQGHKRGVHLWKAGQPTGGGTVDRRLESRLGQNKYGLTCKDF